MFRKFCRHRNLPKISQRFSSPINLTYRCRIHSSYIRGLHPTKTSEIPWTIYVQYRDPKYLMLNQHILLPVFVRFKQHLRLVINCESYLWHFPRVIVGILGSENLKDMQKIRLVRLDEYWGTLLRVFANNLPSNNQAKICNLIFWTRWLPHSGCVSMPPSTDQTNIRLEHPDVATVQIPNLIVLYAPKCIIIVIRQ